MAAFRTLWTALIGLYEETLILVGGNLASVALNLPIGVLLFLVGLALQPDAGQANSAFVVLVVGALVPFLPTPGNIALAALTHAAAGPDVPHFAVFVHALRRRWRLGVACSALSLAIFVALIWNISFYSTLGPGWPLFAVIFWFYATLLWASIHVYVLPLTAHVAEPRLLDLYRRAALIAIGHPGYTLPLLVLLLIVSIAAVAFLPVYVLVAPALVSLVEAHALREIRRRHGDLIVEPEEEVSRL